MKPTFKIAVIAAGFAVAAWPALRAADESTPAQPPPPPAAGGGDNGPEGRPHHWQRDPTEQAQHLKQALDLTQGQFNQVLAIFKDAGAQRQAITNDDSLSRNDIRAKSREIMNGSQAKIRALLTPEQQKKFDAMPRPGWNGRNGGPGHKNPPPPPPAGDAPPPPPPPSDTPAPASPPAAGGT
jgi:Spy/CpxP family protein refolding chaperone